MARAERRGHAVVTGAFRQVAASDGAERSAAAATDGLRCAFLLSSAAALFVAAAAPWAVPLVFSRAFAGAVPAILICLLGAPAAVVAYVATSFLGAGGDARSMTLAQLTGLGTGISLLSLLGPTLGAEGAALASICGYATTAVIAVNRLRLAPGAGRLSRHDARAGWVLIAGHRRSASPSAAGP